MGVLSKLKPHYVYVLMDENGHEVFYVGKGQDDRVFQHAKEVKRGVVETAKQQKIAEIALAGRRVKQTVIARFDSEKEAFAGECTLIHWVYGISSLTNVASGHGVNLIREKGNYRHVPQLEQNPYYPYYVYLLTDSSNNEVFYVGKGTGIRCNHHLKEVENGLLSTLKQKKILNILNKGHEIKPVLVGRFTTEDEALAVESLLIHWVYGIDSLVNSNAGRGVSFIRPKNHYETLQGVDEPELSYCARTKENRERNNVIPYLEELKDFIEATCEIKFDTIHTHNDRHTYLVKFIKGVRLTVCCHHNSKRSAAVTIEAIDCKAVNRERVKYICENTRLECKDNGRYGKIMPAGMYSDRVIILEKFKEMLSELEKVKE